MSLEDDKREDSPASLPRIDAEEEEDDIPGPMDSSPEILEIPRESPKIEEEPVEESPERILSAPTPPPTANSSSVSLLKTAAEASNELQDDDEDDFDDDFDDESLVERIQALSEMFPQGIVSGTSAVASAGLNTVKWVLSNGKVFAWAVFSSAGITLLPIIIESERSRIVEAEKQQQRQILLGPGAAVSGAV